MWKSGRLLGLRQQDFALKEAEKCELWFMLWVIIEFCCAVPRNTPVATGDRRSLRAIDYERSGGVGIKISIQPMLSLNLKHLHEHHPLFPHAVLRISIGFLRMADHV